MMYFQIYNHLDSDNNFSESESNNLEIYKEINAYECIICLEKNSKKFAIVKLTNALIKNEKDDRLEKKCLCESFIHQYCLNKWVKKNESCPICREKFNEIAKPHENKTIYFFIRSFIPTWFCFKISKFFKNFFKGLYLFILLTFAFNVSNFVIVIVKKNI